MKTIKAFRSRTTKEAESILEGGMATATKMDGVIAERFPYGPGELSGAEAAFRTDLEKNGLNSPNSLLAASLPPARDLLSLGISHLATLESFIALSVPQMEDGNNFGVTVQMTVAKHLKETREAWGKSLEKIPAYYKDRAEAVEKLGLTKTTESETKTDTRAESTGGKDGDQKTTETKTVSETKKTNGSEADAHRVGHVVAMDVQMYAEMRGAMTELMDGYVTVLDSMEKNREKLESPKGTGPGNSMGMY